MNRQPDKLVVVDDTRLLRRVDWRFLLSTERVKRSICFGDGRLAQAVAIFSDFIKVETTLQTTNQDGDFDLAVAQNPDEAVLRAAFTALRPGGAGYIEWRAWRSGGARGIQRRLDAAGFSNIKLYWIFPSPKRPRLWIPIQKQLAPGRYIARWEFTGNGLLKKIARKLFVWAFSMFMASGFVPYIGAVAHKPVSPTDGLATRDFFSIIQAEWSRLHPDIPVEKLRYLPQTGGTSPFNKIVTRVFVEPEEFPRWVVKLSRVQESIPSLQCEQALLKQIAQSSKSGAFNLRVPEPLFSCTHNGILLYGQTALAGNSLSRLIKADNLRTYALSLANWQAALQACSKEWPRETTSEAYITQLLAGLESELVGKEFSAEEFSQVRAMVSRLNDLPMTCAHNDFTVWNIIEKDGNLGVIDWVDATDSGLPLLDLVYGLSSMVLIFRNVWEAPGAIDVYQNMIDPATELGQIFTESISLYTKQAGLDPTLVAPLRMMTWMLCYSFELQKRRIQPAAPVNSNQSMYLSLWKFEFNRQKALLTNQ